MAPAAASRSRAMGKKSTADRDSHPPAKKTKLSQPVAAPRQNGFKALLNGTPAVQKPQSSKINGVKNSRKERVDEATAVVGGGVGGHGDVDMMDSDNDAIVISSGEEESSDYSSSGDEREDADAGAEQEADTDKGAPLANGNTQEDEDLQMGEGTAEPEELSFGERLQAQEPEAVHAPSVVDVEAAFVGPDAETRALAVASNKRPLSAPSASSLGTVLTQALRTNDQDLLESCLRVIDVDTIFATVERLPSQLVGTLLQKLAVQLHKRPGRAGTLMLWIQWSLAAHGGYLASQPQLVKQLSTLSLVLKERARSLQPLLSLKGRLDMLHAQLELRRRNQKRATKDEEEEAVIYIEGEDDVSSEEEDQMSDASQDATKGSRKRIRHEVDEDEDESSADEMPTTMEVNEDDSEGESEDSEDMIDDEAEETDNDTGDDMSEPLSDDFIDDAEDVEDSDEESKPAKRSAVVTGGRRRF